jgi:hypothetical protein
VTVDVRADDRTHRSHVDDWSHHNLSWIKLVDSGRQVILNCRSTAAQLTLN